MAKLRWWEKKWRVVIENGGPRFAVFGPFRSKLIALYVAWTIPGPTETAKIERIIAQEIVDPILYREHPSGTVFERTTSERE